MKLMFCFDTCDFYFYFLLQPKCVNHGYKIAYKSNDEEVPRMFYLELL